MKNDINEVANKHVPGPWEIEAAVRTGYTVYNKTTGFIVGCQDEEGRYGAIASEADARLIAAAPDLLEALQQVLHHFVPMQGNLQIEREVIAQAHAAINKATGEKK